ncbi:MAG: hypothetical protein H6682_18935 [Candidatus Eisenbacteria bacterium]|nr:hypothetical protein [Candidatus Eisenbacteria bacterium]
MKRDDGHTASIGRSRRILGALGRVLLGLLLGFVVAEIGSRIYLALPADPDTANFVPDPLAEFRIRPDRPEEVEDPEDHFNQLGVRGREHAVEKPPHTFRVLGIGDSFVFGSVPMRDNFLRVLERESNTDGFASGDTLEVIPLGVPGYNPPHYLGILKSVGLSLDPDLVLVFFFVGNDVTGLPVHGRVYRGELYYVGSSSRWLSLARRSRFLMLAETALLRTLKKMHDTGEEVSSGAETSAAETSPGVEASVGTEAARGTSSTLTPEDSALGSVAASPEPSWPYLVFQRKRLPIYADPPQKDVLALWEEAEQYLLEIDRVCRDHDVPWVLVAIPSEIQLDVGVRKATLAALGRSKDDYDFGAPQARLSEFCVRSGIEYVDLLPALRDAAPEYGPLYIPNNTHWNVEGNDVVGRRLVAVVERHRRN